MIKLTEDERAILSILKENNMLTLRELMAKSKKKQIPAKGVKVIVSELTAKGLITTLKLHGKIYYDPTEYGSYLAGDTRYKRLPPRHTSMAEVVDFLASIS